MFSSTKISNYKYQKMIAENPEEIKVFKLLCKVVLYLYSNHKQNVSLSNITSFFKDCFRMERSPLGKDILRFIIEVDRPEFKILVDSAP